MKALNLLKCGAAALAVLIAVPAMAEQTPSRGTHDSRIRLVEYNPENVVRVTGVFRAASQIVFGEGEAIHTVALGDTVSWEVAPADNAIFIKPREAAPPTNLIVVTKRGAAMRSYTFALSARSGSIGHGTDAQFVVRFRYPVQEQEAAQAARMRELQLQALAVEAGGVRMALDGAAADGPRNLNYSLAGSPDISPSEITDNGQFTVMRFPRNMAIPAIFNVLPDGTEAVVPYDVRGEFVVIHQVSRQLRLRRGRLLSCIWNNAFDQFGPDNSSGTASPVVERQIDIGGSR